MCVMLCNIFFNSGHLPMGVKATIITLIPKTSHASSILDLRPISLCNIFYKIVKKLLATRFKPILPFIIHENQAGFIHKRCLTNNIIHAYEILKEFKSSKRLFCAKLDIKNAFDSISRVFLLNRMRQKGFPEEFIRWIKSCISNVHFYICLNDTSEGFFNSSSGLC